MFRLALQSLIFLTLFMIVRSNSNYTCNMSGDGNSISKFKRGQTVHFCVHYVPAGVKSIFKIEVDKFVGLSVTRAYEAFKETDTDIGLQLENTTVYSELTVS